MYMRITAQMQANNSIAYIQQANARLANYETQVSSGVQLQEPSDNPIGYTTVAQDQTESLQYAAYSQNMTSANATLSTSASALQNVNNILSQAQTLATQAADPSSGGATGYAAIASQVNSLISELLNNANAKQGGGYLFAGTASNTQPFTVSATDASGNPTAVTYNGSTDAAQAVIGPNQTVNTQYVGSQVFQKSGSDVFQALINLQQNLLNPTLAQSQNSMSQALNQNLSQISSAQSAIRNVEAEQASTQDSVTSLQVQIQNFQLTADTQASNISDTDYASAIVQMQEQQTVLQASEEVSSKMLQQSLLNFLQ